MRQRKLKCYIGNIDGLREGLVLAYNKKDAATIAKLTIYHFSMYWTTLDTEKYKELIPMTLYTRFFDTNTQWINGYCRKVI